MMTIRMSLLLIPLLLAGCAATPTQEAAETVAQDGEMAACRDLNGHYRAQPHPVADVKTPERSLLAILLLPYEAQLEQAQSVKLQLDEAGGMQIAAYAADGSLLGQEPLTVKAGDYRCEEGQLYLTRPDHAAGPEREYAWEQVVLRRTEDDNLMVRKGGLFSGTLFMMFPLSLSAGDWFVFRPME